MIIAFTGAGISKASGIPTFEEHPEISRELAINLWDREPQRVWKAIQIMKGHIDLAQPNAAHMTLAQEGIPIVTQNVDGLHQMAGSQNVIEIHGNLHNVVCLTCGNLTKLGVEMVKCPDHDQWMKPDAVFYGESLRAWWKAVDLIGQATTLLVIGTSLTVAPACNFPPMAQRNGAKIVHINANSQEEVPKFLAGSKSLK